MHRSALAKTLHMTTRDRSVQSCPEDPDRYHCNQQVRNMGLVSYVASDT